MEYLDNGIYAGDLDVVHIHYRFHTVGLIFGLSKHYTAKSYNVIFALQFIGLLDVLEENRGHICNPEEVLSPKHLCTVIQKNKTRLCLT